MSQRMDHFCDFSKFNGTFPRLNFTSNNCLVHHLYYRFDVWVFILKFVVLMVPPTIFLNTSASSTLTFLLSSNDRIMRVFEI